MQEKITLRAARVNAGLTIADAAKKIGVNADTLSRWEQGITSPSVIHLKPIKRAYKTRYDNIDFKRS